jgi:hypothetical protein
MERTAEHINLEGVTNGKPEASPHLKDTSQFLSTNLGSSGCEELVQINS